MEIKILGSGCPNCKVLEANARKAVLESGKDVDITKVTDISEIMKYGVMSTPAIVIDEKVVSMGKILSSAEIKKIIDDIK